MFIDYAELKNLFAIYDQIFKVFRYKHGIVT